MGNCLAINVNIHIPCDSLFTACCSQECEPRRRTITDLRNDWAMLKAARDDIARTIEESTELPLEIVKQWLLQVATLDGKIETFITDYEHESFNTCLCGYSRKNCKESCMLWRKIGSINKEVLRLHSQVPDVVIEKPRISPALQVQAEFTTGIQLMLNEVYGHIENQQDDHARIIGLYGMGGVGKTTLLKEINNKLRDSTLNFDLQLWIVVSKTPNLVDIQNRIGEHIGLRGDPWKVKSQDDKAMDIYNFLLKKKYILLLDDIWERFNLAKVGMPLPNSINKSMVIFTTRSLQVCGQMEAIPIHVRCLNDEEAWTLFKKSAGRHTLEAHPDIDVLARVIMRKCNGLPLALIVIGRAMTLKTTIDVWKHDIQVLQRYTADFSTIAAEVFTLLKYSYDNLINDEIRSCFLYCSLYGEDQEILKSDLVDKWICEGFLGRFDDLPGARNDGYSYINILVGACLLEKCSVEEKVKMHDVIRDTAIWIARDVFYVKAHASLTEVPNDVKWGAVKKLSLMNNSIRELNNGPTKVTNMETVLINSGGFCYIRNNFFEFVPKLKVLDLSGNRELTRLPDEICKVVFLEYLNLSRTNINGLPDEFGKLVNMKYLNVWGTEISTVPEGLLSSMKKMSVFKCGNDRHIDFYDFLRANLVKEFEGLKYLHEVKIIASNLYN